MARLRTWLPDAVRRGEGVFIAPGAVVTGTVALGERASVWYQAVVRGDGAPITIGAETNIQDGSILHVDPPFPLMIGDRVTVGHRVVLHGCRIEDECLIGIGAIVLNDARIGRHSIIGAGALVTEGMIVPPGSLVLGLPGRVVRTLDEDDAERIRANAAVYVDLAAHHARRLES